MTPRPADTFTASAYDTAVGGQSVADRSTFPPSGRTGSRRADFLLLASAELLAIFVYWSKKASQSTMQAQPGAVLGMPERGGAMEGPRRQMGEGHS